MSNPVDDHLDEIIDLCREFGVARLELFGSAATGEFDPERSDIDFLVEYPEGYDFGPFLARRFELQQRLEQVLGLDVDLVVLRNVRNPFVRQSISESRRELFAA